MTPRTIAAAAAAALAAAVLLAWMGRAGSPAGEEEAAMKRTEKPAVRYSKAGYDITPLPPDRVEELASRLDPESYQVTMRAGTEPAFCGNLHDNHEDGVYACAVCGLPLFASGHKFDSGTGWPSFFRAVDPEHVGEREDRSHGMVRTEIFCARCGAHLGHVFQDGPRPTGLRYCVNSASLVFHEEGEPLPPESLPAETQTAYFGGGCFWGVEHAFQQYPGVLDVASGYQGGRTEDPTYKEVCSDETGHAETVKVVFDPARVSYEKLVRFFFEIHDPTTPNRQGPDVGTQYRSAIFTASDAQRAVAEKVIRDLAERKAYGGRKIVTEVSPAGPFYPAEDYHQDYIEKTGRACHIDIGRALRAAGVEP